MKTRLISALSALLLVPFAGGAQQLNQPRTIEPFQPMGSSDSASGNRLPPPQSHKASQVRQDAAQRDKTPKVAAETGIETQRPEQPASTQPNAPVKPIRVTDAQGIPIAGAVQMGPNRVMDPKTGRIYSTVPNGDGQRIIEPRRK
jgi:hypothetical protein